MLLLSTFSPLSWRLLLKRSATDHVSFYFFWNLFILSIQVLHGLVLGLFGPHFNIFDLLAIIGIRLANLVDFAQLLVINALLGDQDIIGGHVSINGFTLRQRLLAFNSDIHLLL